MNIFHEINCGCGADLTQQNSVRVHLSTEQHEWDELAYVTQGGELQHALANQGAHAGSYCVACDNQIEELEEDDGEEEAG